MRTNRITCGLTPAALALGLLLPAAAARAAAPTGLVEEPRLGGLDIAEANLDQPDASRQNELQLVRIKGYVDISPGQGFLQIEVARFGDEDVHDDGQWITVREHIAVLSSTKSVSGTTYHVFDSSLQIFELAKHEDPDGDGENRVWQDGGMARFRVRAVRTDSQGKVTASALLPTRDNQGKKTRRKEVTLVDHNATRETQSYYINTGGSVFTEPFFLGALPGNNGSLSETEAYYQAVGTNPDGTGLTVNLALPTLRAFRQRYFHAAKPAGAPSGCSTRSMTVDDDTTDGPAIYFNKGDLGTGRKMRCNYNSCTDETACYVGNLGLPNGEVLFDQQHGRELSQGTIDSNKPFATVCMVERGKMPKNAVNKTFFLVYRHDGHYDDVNHDPNVANEAQLDSELSFNAALDNISDNEFIPGNCAICHGGVPYNRDGVPGLVGATFLPFDLQNSFAYYDGTKYAQATQEPKFRTLNRIVAKTDLWDLADTTGVRTARVIMNKWYGASETNSSTSNWGSLFKKDQIPSNDWSANDGQKQLYLKVVAPTCRTCHMTHIGTSWSTFQSFNDNRIEVHFRACKLRVEGVDFTPARGVMPNSEQGSNAFWRSDARAQLVDRLNIAQGCGLTGDQFSDPPALAAASLAATAATGGGSFYDGYAAAVCACTTTACYQQVEDDYAARLGSAGRVNPTAALAALKKARECREAIQRGQR